MIGCHATQVLTPAGLVGNPPLWILFTLISLELESGTQTHHRGLTRRFNINVLLTIVLKTCARELTRYLCALFNLSFAEGKLPTEWKDGLVVPVHRKGKKEDVTNYRPISLLCVVSKV